MRRRRRLDRIMGYPVEGGLHDTTTGVTHDTYGHWYGETGKPLGQFRKRNLFGCSCRTCRSWKRADKLLRVKRARACPQDEVPSER